MKSILIALLLLSYTSVFSQQQGKLRIEQLVSIGTPIPTGLPADIDSESGFSMNFGFLGVISMKKEWNLETGLTYQWMKFVVDGYFLNENDNFLFKITPADYKQHSISTGLVNLPVKLKKVFENEASLGFGVISSYYTDSKDKYKIGVDKYEVDEINFQRFQFSPVLDVDIIKTSKKKYIKIGMSIQYQVTSYTSGKSFKPLIVEFRLQNPLF